ncbi:MAG: hypothetical protein GY820_17395, partial [Gammaproteobacteria bacterium]|nr:hypothetical protein [Gammaproteobacteria bacterium]
MLAIFKKFLYFPGSEGGGGGLAEPPPPGAWDGVNHKQRKPGRRGCGFP